MFPNKRSRTDVDTITTTTTTTITNIPTLPDELWSCIGQFLRVNQLTRLALTCRQLALASEFELALVLAPLRAWRLIAQSEILRPLDALSLSMLSTHIDAATRSIVDNTIFWANTADSEYGRHQLWNCPDCNARQFINIEHYVVLECPCSLPDWDGERRWQLFEYDSDSV